MEQVNREELERAARRIMEMNNRAQSAVSRRRAPAEPEKEVKTAGKHEKEENTPPPPMHKMQNRNSIFDIINFKKFAGDSDRTLLAGIMLLLGADAADEKLMLALLYIML